ncbi:MAG: ribonuclease HII [Candidatus Aminicenantes bacterium]|nr:ribonuclease HII [Candidatus Aminicenantes bacterium]
MMGVETEKNLVSEGYKLIAGLDEVGRGCLLGPVVAAVVVFPPAFYMKKMPFWSKEIADSKLLSPTKRKWLGAFILSEAADFGLGYATSEEIDRMNIYWASQLAMKRAVEDLILRPDIILVDGYEIKDINYFQRGIPQGDRRVFCIAAASILAKVFRDELMCALDQIFPEYALEKNKGYGTEEHYQALEKYGPCLLHRRTFRLHRDRWLIETE